MATNKSQIESFGWSASGGTEAQAKQQLNLGELKMKTEGQWRVGVDFNPSGSTDVAAIKEDTADLIDRMQEIAKDREHPGARNASLAMTAYEEAAMWAVKAITKEVNT